MTDYYNIYYKMMRIRKFEQMLLNLFSKGELNGTVHTCIGQEATPVALSNYIKEGDVVFSNHRSHGHLLALGVPIDRLLGEIMGKYTGFCEGRGGSQHIYYKDKITIYTNGIQGGIVGNAVGSALAQKLNKSNNVTIVFLGDGTMGEGLVYESLNFAALHALPILFICENNHYAMSTPIEKTLAGSDILVRVKGFNLPFYYLEDKDANRIEIYLNIVRQDKKPTFLEIDTYRLAPHSKGDDFRDPKEIKNHADNYDCLNLLEKQLNREETELIKIKIDEELEKVYNDTKERSFACYSQVLKEDEFIHPSFHFPVPQEKTRFVESINIALHQLLEDKDTIILGEDIADPYGSAFKATKGLSTKYPNQVFSTPISEAGIVAWSTGAALQGKKAIAEIMFGDFLLLAADQIVNHACKYNWVYNHQVKVPITIRTPMGGYRSYGPTHSQTLEKMFIGTPGLKIVVPNIYTDPGELLKRSVNYIHPVLFIENKSLYGMRMKSDTGMQSLNSMFPTIWFNTSEDPEIAIICYGGMLELALEAVKEFSSLVICPTLISPSNVHIERIIQKSSYSPKCIFTLEEACVEGGWGSDVISGLVEKGVQAKYKRIGTEPNPIPCAKQLEKETLPSVEKIVNIIKGTI